MVAEVDVGSRARSARRRSRLRLAKFVGRRLARRVARAADPGLRGNRLQRDRQRARDARARGQDDRVLRGLSARGRGERGERQRRLGGSGCEVPRHHECQLDGAYRHRGDIRRHRRLGANSYPAAVTPEVAPLSAAESASTATGSARRSAPAAPLGPTGLRHRRGSRACRSASGGSTLQRTPSFAIARASAITRPSRRRSPPRRANGSRAAREEMQTIAPSLARWGIAGVADVVGRAQVEGEVGLEVPRSASRPRAGRQEKPPREVRPTACERRARPRWRVLAPLPGRSGSSTSARRGRAVTS